MAADVRSAHVPAWVPFFNPIARLLLAVGIPMGPNKLVTINGRKSGLPRTTPLSIPAGGWPRHYQRGPAEAVDFIRDVLGPHARQTLLGSWIVRHVDQIDFDHPAEAAKGRPVFELHPR